MNGYEKMNGQIKDKAKVVNHKVLKSNICKESIVETAIDGIICIDKNGLILSWNEAASTMFGYAPDDILGKSILEIIKIDYLSLDNEESVRRFLDVGLRRNYGKILEFIAINKSKVEFPVEFSIAKWKFEKETYFTGIFRDITERQQKNVLLQKMHLALNNSKDVVIMTDGKGTITYVNTEFTKVYGYKSFEVVGKHTPRILKSEGNKEHFEEIWKKISNKESVELTHYRNKKKNGDLLDVEGHISPVLDAKNDIIGYLSIQHIITERINYISKLESAYKKLKESERLKSEFIANLSHEFRTPLYSIIGLSGLIDRDTKKHDLVEYSKIIHKSGEDLLDLVEDIFNIYLLENKFVKVIKKQTDLLHFLNEFHKSMKDFQHSINKEHINFILKYPLNHKSIVINVDYIKLKHILLNILNNAFKFTEKGDVEYGFSFCNSDDKTTIEFFVSDTGVGINKDKHDIIFEAFRQVNGSFNRNQEGIGIGLAIVIKLVNSLEGNIWLESEEGHGSKFFFSIPVEIIELDNI